MRHFIVVGHDAPTDADFSLDDLPGEGRLDLLCRCVNAGLLLSHGLREDAKVSLVLRGEATIVFDGSELGGLNPDERSIAGVIRKALQRLEGRGSLPDGVRTKTHGLEEELENVDGTIIQLHEDGKPVNDIDPPENAVFVLSDHRGFTDREERIVKENAEERAKLGPAPLHADHAIAVANNYLDTHGYTDY